MLFNSLDFIIFFPVVAFLYFLIPAKGKHVWLLLASYYFYMSWNAGYAVLILCSTVITYTCGRLLERAGQIGDEKKKRFWKTCCLTASLTANLFLLFLFKYYGFAASALESLLPYLGITVKMPEISLLLPVGISFYTFQALGYTIDVYRDELRAEKNLIQYALFVSFFPQLVAGPIERAGNLLSQLRRTDRRFDYEQAREGLLLMLWGYFLKLVLADRIAIFVNTVYGDYESYGGVYLILATILFAFQIYCDFAGYSVIATGAARIMGFTLMENFDAPYLSCSVSEFWRGWHISLSSWFRDYLYIPLGGNRKGRGRKFLNLFLVFCISGLWHGANWTFVIWGALNGLYQIAGEVCRPLRERLRRFFRLRAGGAGERLAAMAVTFCLVDFAWLFFRAQSVGAAFAMIKSIRTQWNPWILFDGSLYELGLSEKSFTVMLLSLAVLLAADVMKYRGVCIRRIILAQTCWFRYLVFAGSALLITLIGVWGIGFAESGFIYFQF